MDAAASDRPQRLTLCLVADEQAVDRFPTTLRYLQIGLIDEPIDTIFVIPERRRAAHFAGGPATAVSHQGIRWPLGRWERLGVARTVRQRIAALHHEAPVVVHALTASAVPLAAEIAGGMDGDLVVTVGSISELNAAAVTRYCEKAAVIVVPSQQLVRAIRASPLAGKSVQHVPVGVVSAYAPAAFSNSDRAPSMIFAGALSADCGVDLFLRAVKLALLHHPNLLAFVVGTGPAESGLRALADSLELNTVVTFTGRLEQWRLALEAADVFCLPTSAPGFREEAVHALAAGVVLIAPTDALCDGLVDGETALLFPPDDHIALANQIGRLLDDQALGRRLAAAGQARARANNSISRSVSEHVRIYREIASRRVSLPLTPG